MSASQISSRARAYALYTGAPRQLACDVVAALPPGTPFIPAPTEHAQLLFECEIFYWVLNSQRHFFENPLGIRYVRHMVAYSPFCSRNERALFEEAPTVEDGDPVGG
ncbi:hypothetical protein OG369_39375 [Streptomyces sp. NBC_01221]|uniref:hypothetical protein n=1 Tax=Streptomyces sp. NBC_01221 TaxID=2903782 RepID=UPI0022500E52|nr:hypothetical protein [Streptomyces sp. NBC_01221]MCX4791922.1 hypothetical protein [Streptomyces sp. NBC_01221]